MTDQLAVPTRERLLAAAQELIEEGGYGAASVAAIAERAGVAAGTLLDGIARHTREGYAFQALAMRDGFREAVRQRDEPFGDLGRSTFKG